MLAGIIKINTETSNMIRSFRIAFAVLLLCVFARTGSAQVTESRIYRNGSQAIEHSEIQFNKGLLRLSELDLAKAVKEFQNSPAADRASLLEAMTERALGNYSIAGEKAGRFINERNNSPLVPYAALLRGHTALEQRELPSAAKHMKKAVILAKKETDLRNDIRYRKIIHEALYWQGIAYALQGNYQSAGPVFQECYREHPEGKYADDALFALGESAEINRRYEEAVKYFRLIGSDYPFSNSFVSSRIREANNKLTLREPNSALVTLKKAESTINHIFAADSIGILYEPQTYISSPAEDIMYLRGEAYNSAGNFDEALLIFNAFLNTYTDSPRENYVRLGAGWAHLNLGNNEQALNHYESVIYSIGDGPGQRIRAIAQLYRAVALKRSGQVNVAQNEFTNLSFQPTYPFLGQVLLELGQIYYEEGNYPQAQRTLERADREAIDAVVACRIHLILGATYMELTRWTKAVSEYEAAQQLALKSTYIVMPRRDWYLAEARLKQGIALVQSHRSAESIPVLLAFIGDNKTGRRSDEALFWLAEAYYRSDMLKNAQETYKSLVEQYPGSKLKEEAYYGLGWSYFRLRDFRNSSETFNKMIEQFPETKHAVEVLARQGDGYYLAKSYRNASRSYKRAKNMAPNTDEGQYSAFQLCDALYRMNAKEEAITQLMDFIRLYPRSSYAPNAMFLMGWIRFQQQKYREAIDDFQYLIQAYTSSSLVPRAHYAIGDCNYNMGSYEQAIEAYKTVVESFPTNALAPEAMKSIQQCYIILGREDEAMAIANNFIDVNPDSPYAVDFTFNKGNMFYSGRKYRDAISEFEAFSAKYPDSEKNAEGLYWMEKSYINLNEPEKAEETFIKLRKNYPDSDFTPIGMLELALMHLQLNDIKSADSVFRQLQAAYPKSSSAAQAGFERALINYSMGDTATAMNLFRQVADDYPGEEYSDQSRWKIAMHLRSKSLNDSARTEFKKIVDGMSNPDIAAEAQYRIGELFFRDEMYEEAVAEFLKFKENYSGYDQWYLLTLLNMGEAYEKLEKYEEAREVYQSLQALSPDSDYGKTAKRRLRRLPAN